MIVLSKEYYNLYLEMINIDKDTRVTEVLEIVPSPMEKNALEFDVLTK